MKKIYKSKKLILDEKRDPVDPAKELKVFEELLNDMILEENYESAEIIRVQMEAIKILLNSRDNLST